MYYKPAIFICNINLSYSQVNGVAAIHAEIVKSDVFPQFVDYYAKRGTPHLSLSPFLSPFLSSFLSPFLSLACERARALSLSLSLTHTHSLSLSLSLSLSSLSLSLALSFSQALSSAGQRLPRTVSVQR